MGRGDCIWATPDRAAARSDEAVSETLRGSGALGASGPYHACVLARKML